MMRICANAAKRSRMIASATSTLRVRGLDVDEAAASAPPPMKPSAQKNAANGRRIQRGTNAPESRQIAPATSATSDGESANQSTDGVSIIGSASA